MSISFFSGSGSGSDVYGSAPPYLKVPTLMYQVFLHNWCRDAIQMSTQKVARIDMCSAPTSGRDTHGKRAHNVDSHTFLCAYLEPTTYRKQEVVAFERVKFPGGFHGGYHSAVPLTDIEGVAGGDTYATNVSDIVSIIPQNPPTAIIHKLDVERSIELDNHLTLQELATILQLIEKITRSAWPGVSCDNTARLFAFTCWAALTPAGKSPVGKSVHEDEARYFLDQLTWRTRDMDAQSLDAVKFIQEKRAALLKSDR